MERLAIYMHWTDECRTRDATEMLWVGRERERVEDNAWLEVLGNLLFALSELGPRNYTYGRTVSMKEL